VSPTEAEARLNVECFIGTRPPVEQGANSLDDDLSLRLRPRPEVPSRQTVKMPSSDGRFRQAFSTVPWPGRRNAGLFMFRRKSMVNRPRQPRLQADRDSTDMRMLSGRRRDICRTSQD